jgi:hypothetical protein
MQHRVVFENRPPYVRQPSNFVPSRNPHFPASACFSAKAVIEISGYQRLYCNPYHLGQFVEKREQLLLEVIQGLDSNSNAALGLIYMRKDHLESPVILQGPESQALERLTTQSHRGLHHDNN